MTTEKDVTMGELADALARCTGATRVVVQQERRNEDGTLTVTASAVSGPIDIHGIVR